MIKSVIVVTEDHCKTYTSEMAAERAVRTAHREAGEKGTFGILLSRTIHNRVLPILFGMDRTALETMAGRGFKMIM